MKTSKLRKYRELKDYTLMDMAYKLGISFPHLSLLERGLRKPSITLVFLIEKKTGGYVRADDWK